MSKMRAPMTMPITAARSEHFSLSSTQRTLLKLPLLGISGIPRRLHMSG